MSIFISAGFRGEELKLLNEIRMSLQAITIADITTADGRSIHHSDVLLQQSNGLRKHYDWPRAVPLSPKLRALRKNLFRLICCNTLTFLLPEPFASTFGYPYH